MDHQLEGINIWMMFMAQRRKRREDTTTIEIVVFLTTSAKHEAGKHSVNICANSETGEDLEEKSDEFWTVVAENETGTTGFSNAGLLRVGYELELVRD